jgi:hypothetical protein
MPEFTRLEFVLQQKYFIPASQQTGTRPISATSYASHGHRIKRQSLIYLAELSRAEEEINPAKH